MANVPTVPGSEIDINTPERAVRLDAGALSGPRLRGQAAISSAVGAVGDVAEGLQDQLMKARNAGIAADVDLKMRTARQSFLESLRNDPNEGWKSADDSAWKDRAAEVASSVREDILSEHTRVPPEMRQQIEHGFKSWESSLLLESQSMANVQMTTRAWGRSKEDYADALKDGHGEHAMNILRVARDTKIAPPEEVDQLERDIPRTIARNFIENGLQANPKGTEDLLKSGASLPAVDQNGKRIVPKEVLRPKEMEQLQNTARARASSWQRENFGVMISTKADPITGYVPDETIDEGMASGEIDPKVGTNLKRAQERRLKTQDRETAAVAARVDRDDHSLLVARIHDPSAWTVDPDGYAHDLTQEAAGISSPALRQDALSSINRQLAAVRKTGETAERPIERQMYQLMNEDRDTNTSMIPLSVEDVPEGKGSSSIGAALGLGYTPGTKATTKYPPIAGGLAAVKKQDFDMSQYPGMTKDSVISQINRHASKLQNEMAQWFKSPEGQKATWDQADAHRQTLERPYVMDAVRQTLKKKEPSLVATREEYDLLPAGAPFVWNGQLGFKP